ncbi:PTS mannose transporter subunit IID [Enterococcus florum]|uniref:PTS mannose transporter subunit IID n=1 Tax=Enterococcus florum TaxID=2480627 RepID=A0A4P5PAJ4_9ENTE|nr:PTS mannose/fructose/sorbose family IIA subunit [Enterococcus florum]GCF95125.1 PTS mannose transporter subunit IID [Enterococcus florum]
MIGVLVVAHGDLGKALLDSIGIIAGKVECADSVGLHHGDSPDEFRTKIQKAAMALDTGKGVLVLVDFFGGTPGNETLKCLANHEMKVLSGVNMAMLLEVVVHRAFITDIEELSKLALESGKTSIQDLNQIYEKMIEKAGD